MLGRVAFDFPALMMYDSFYIDCMRPTVQSVKKKALPVLRAAGVGRAALFGSTVRGQWHRGSDVDFLIEFTGRKSLLDLIALEQRLEKVLGTRVDVVTYRSLHPLVRDRILQEQQPIM